MSEEKFPVEMSLVIVDDLYKNYDLGFNSDEDDLLIYCNTCDDIVATLDYKKMDEMGDMDLYERIIEAHRESYEE